MANTALLFPPPQDRQQLPLNKSAAVAPSGDPVQHCGDGSSCLRGLQWRTLLGVLPPSHTPVENLRHAAADGRRRYAELRRRVLVDPHLAEDFQRRPPQDANMDNPLSQDPDSVWGKYFRNAEVERMIESDLARLYPEHGTLFQSPARQAMLRRILLVWSLNHPQYSYRQGMHELLAPLLYSLHSDVEHFSEVKKRYGDYFDDKFDDSFLSRLGVATEGGNGTIPPLIEPTDDLGFDLRVMVSGNDSYGPEGELGSLFSTRFLEHDAYSMFDALMRGRGGRGVIAMAEFFIVSNGSASPVLEASAALYRALAVADRALYGHLWDLGVEPQFFALRWLRVLFGREFGLESLLLLWDAIFSKPDEVIQLQAENGRYSRRSTFITAFAVSMILYLKPSLLAAANTTNCLQRMLNFPPTASVRSLIKRAELLQPLVEEAVQAYGNSFERNKALRRVTQPHSDSYWEQKWKNSVLHRVSPATESSQETGQGQGQCIKKKKKKHNNDDDSSKEAADGISYSKKKATRRKLLDAFSEAMDADSSLCRGGHHSPHLSDSQGEQLLTDSTVLGDKEEEEEEESPFQKSPGGGRFSRLWNHLGRRRNSPDNNNKYNSCSTQSSSKKKKNSDSESNDDEDTDHRRQGLRWWPFSGRDAVSDRPNTANGNLLISEPESESDSDKSSLKEHQQVSPVNDSIEFLSNTSDYNNQDILMEETAPLPPSIGLQRLGQSMLDNIQVIESALGEAVPSPPPSLSKEGGGGMRDEAFEAFPVESRGHAALMELRNIGNMLLQMEPSP